MAVSGPLFQWFSRCLNVRFREKKTLSPAFPKLSGIMNGGIGMNADNVNKWLTLSANIGVVIGLVLLIVEIGQNTEMMRAQINQSRTDTAISQQQAIFNSDYIPALLAKRNRGEPFSEEERIRYTTLFRSGNRNQDNNLWQYNQGFLGENIPRSIRDFARAVIGGSEIGITTWDSQKYTYTDEYVAFVEEAIEDLR